MKIVKLLCVTMMMAANMAMAQEPLTLRSITDGTFRADYVSGINPIAGTGEYAQISLDGNQVVKYSFKTGEQTGVLFDVMATRGEFLQDFDDYLISPDGKTLLIETNHQRIYRRSYLADYYIYSVKEKTLSKLSPNGPLQVPTFSPDGKHIAFVRQNNIFITDGKTENQITSDGKFNRVINGIPDWVNEEEFSFNTALAWSADGKTLSWIRYDESRVKTYSLQLFQGANPTQEDYEKYPGLYSFKYPKAGQENAKVTAWSYDVKSGRRRKYKLPLADDDYIPRIKTMPNAKDGSPQILICTMNRHQDELRLYVATPTTGACQQIITESNPKYVKEEVLENSLVTDKYIVLPSDRDGYMHLYLYKHDGTFVRQLESGNYDVTEVYGFDDKNEIAYIQAAAQKPMNREVYAVRKGELHPLSEGGWNDAIFSGDLRYFVNTWSDAEHPYVFTIHNNVGLVVKTMVDNKKLADNLAAYQLPKKEFFKMTTSEGVTLNGWMLRPADFNPNDGRKYPVIMFQYSGPGSQQVVDSWSIGSMGQGALFDQYLVQQGFIVVCVDGRGTGGRGSDFEKSTYLRIGDLESKDQVEVALWLAGQDYVDGDRIGIWGWSYGGFNTLMSLSEGRPVFRAGVAVAPPTNWKYYDTIYTERYMRTPQENPEGYAINPIARVDNLHGALLICHGLADDNVHPQNTFEYSEALVQADKDFKENIYTNRNHSIYGGNTRNHLFRQISQFFIEQLAPTKTEEVKTVEDVKVDENEAEGAS